MNRKLNFSFWENFGKELACYVSYLPLQIVSFQIPQAGGIYFHRLLWSKIGIPAKDEKNPTSLGVTIAYPVWAPISLLMPFFSSVINVSHRRTLQVKKKVFSKRCSDHPDMLVIMLIDLGNCNKQTGWFQADKLKKSVLGNHLWNCPEFDKSLL